jgi:phosphatidylserine decarboxylase
MSHRPLSAEKRVVATGVESTVTGPPALQADEAGAAPVASPVRGWRAWRDRLLLQEDLNFLLTNRVPRIALTRAMGHLSRIRHPWVTRISIAIWRTFTELDLSEARESHFASLHACFVRELKPGARPIDPRPEVLVSPCDGIVGAHGTVVDGLLLQAKGMPYRLADLLGSDAACEPYLGGSYVTLRLTSAMYHRFHAPDRGTLLDVRHIDGDTWNVNPIALKRIERLFCRNERAAIRLRATSGGHTVTLVAVAAILVSGLRIHGLGQRLHAGLPGSLRVDLNRPVRRGEELGWFEHGSTIIVLAPVGLCLRAGLATGHRIRMGEALLEVAAASGPST